MTHHTFDLLVVALLVCAVLFYRHRWRRERNRVQAALKEESLTERLYERGLEVRAELRREIKEQQKSIRNYVNQLRRLQDRADFMRMMGDSDWEHIDGIAHDGCDCNACYARRRVQENAANGNLCVKDGVAYMEPPSLHSMLTFQSLDGTVNVCGYGLPDEGKTTIVDKPA